MRVENLIQNVPKIKLAVVSPAGPQLADPGKGSLKAYRNKFLPRAATDLTKHSAHPKPSVLVTFSPSSHCTATGPSEVMISANSLPSPGLEVGKLDTKILGNNLGWLIPEGFAINPSSRRSSVPRVDILASDVERNF